MEIIDFTNHKKIKTFSTVLPYSDFYIRGVVLLRRDEEKSEKVYPKDNDSLAILHYDYFSITNLKVRFLSLFRLLSLTTKKIKYIELFTNDEPYSKTGKLTDFYPELMGYVEDSITEVTPKYMLTNNGYMLPENKKFHKFFGDRIIVDGLFRTRAEVNLKYITMYFTRHIIAEELRKNNKDYGPLTINNSSFLTFPIGQHINSNVNIINLKTDPMC